MWGDAIALIALSEIFSARIFVVSAVSGNHWAVWITPTRVKKSTTVLLSHAGDLNFAPLQHSFNRSLFAITPKFEDSKSLLAQNEDVMVPITDVQLGAVLGEGVHGTTYKASWKGVEVVAKKLSDEVVTSDKFAEIRGELGLLKRLRHPHCLLFLACAESIATIPDVLMIHEWMPRGSLAEWLESDEGVRNLGALLDPDDPITRAKNTTMADRAWTLRLKFASDIASGLHYLHSMGIIHRSFSADNVLLDRALHAKVGGFGMARVFGNAAAGDIFSGGNLAWIAPEVFNAVQVSKLVDVFAFGIVMWQLMACKKPYTSPRELGTQEIIIGVSQGTLRPPLPPTDVTIPPYVDLVEYVSVCRTRVLTPILTLVFFFPTVCCSGRAGRISKRIVHRLIQFSNCCRRSRPRSARVPLSDVCTRTCSKICSDSRKTTKLHPFARERARKRSRAAPANPRAMSSPATTFGKSTTVTCSTTRLTV
jgi:serine/threonine protein kinase